VKVHKNRVLRRIFGPKRGEVMGGWRKMHNEVFNLCSSLNIRVIKSRRMKWTGHVPYLGKMKNVYTVLVRRPQGKRPLGRPRHRWEGDI